jgi:hypothetical protein
MSNRRQKAEDLFEVLLDAFEKVLKRPPDEIDSKDLKVVSDFLKDQGINCDGAKNERVTGLSKTAGLPKPVQLHNH